MSNRQLAKDVQAVHDYIAEHGWCRGKSYDDQGRACLMGGIWGVVSSASFPSRSKAVEDVLVEEIGQHIKLTTYPDAPYGRAVRVGTGWRDPIPYFNDEVLNSQEEALEFLQKVRIQVEEKA